MENIIESITNLPAEKGIGVLFVKQLDHNNSGVILLTGMLLTNIPVINSLN